MNQNKLFTSIASIKIRLDCITINVFTLITNQNELFQLLVLLLFIIIIVIMY